jgi:hypothetical protein
MHFFFVLRKVCFIYILIIYYLSPDFTNLILWFPGGLRNNCYHLLANIIKEGSFRTRILSDPHNISN